jgi:Flp pilus assembly protein TadB
MELILTLLAFGKNNPTISLCVVFAFLFVYSVVILRKRRKVSDAVNQDINEVKAKVNEQHEEVTRLLKRSYRTAEMLKNDSDIVAIRKADAAVSSYNHMLVAGLAWAIPVYYLWAPLIALTLPVTLALACVYPDKLRNLISKTVDSKPVSE